MVGKVTAVTLYTTYVTFCSENGLDPVSRYGFSSRLRSMENEYNMKYSTNVPKEEKNSTGYVRGFFGIGIKRITVPNTNYTNNTMN